VAQERLGHLVAGGGARAAQVVARSDQIAQSLVLGRGPVESGQYTALAFGHTCRQAAIAQSNSRPGSPHDNAVKESFFATLAKERLRGRRYATHARARSAIFEYEGWYNPRRLHSTLGYRSPDEAEGDYHRHAARAA